jgi:ABC-type glycerol-3-phosphate transport system substrate-binding protein
MLEKVLTFYLEAETAGLMPYWLTQYQSDELTWEAFMEKRADQVVTWSSRYLGSQPEDSAITTLITPDGKPFTLATGWVWALATSQVDKQELSIELAEFLTEGSFLAAWTEAVGYLPTRPSALAGWTNTQLQETLRPIVNSALLLPPSEVLTSVGPPLQQATVQVLKKQSDPLTAAQAAVEGLTSP